MRLLYCLLLMMLLSGCASMTAEHTRTLLIDRSTGEMMECTVDKWRSEESFKRYDQCVLDYQKQGYEIWSQY